MSDETKPTSNNIFRDDGDYYETLPYPRVIQIETTARCNLRCSMCAAKGRSRNGLGASRSDMADSLYGRIISELEPCAEHVETLSLFMDGEPLLDKRLPSFVRTAKDAGFKTVNIATNGVLLHGGTAKALVDSGLDTLIVSIDSMDPEVYASIRIGADLKTVTDNVQAFMAMRVAKKRALPHVCVRMIEMQENRGEQEAFRAFWRNIVDEVRFQPCHNWGSSLPNQEENTFSHPPARNWPFRNMVIYSDGRAGFCCLDFEGIYDLGSFQHHTFEEIWRGPGYAQLREWMKNRDPEHLRKCRHCDFPSLAPFQSRHWKTLMIDNQTGEPSDVFIAHEENGEMKRSSMRRIDTGNVLPWGILYEGQAGVSVCCGNEPDATQWVPFHPAQMCYEVRLCKA